MPLIPEPTPGNTSWFTQNGNRLYLHIFSWPFKYVHIDGPVGRVEYAQFLHDASQIHFVEVDPQAPLQNTTMRGKEGQLTLELPVVQPNSEIPVVEFMLR